MILTIFFKDLKLFFKSTSALMITFIVPMVLILIFGSVFSGFGNQSSINAIRVIVVDNDQTFLSKRFSTSLDSLKEIKVIYKFKKNDVISSYDNQTMDSNIKKGKQKVGIIIKKGFGNAIENGTTPKLEIHYDPKFQIEYGITNGLSQKVVMSQFPELLTKGMFKKAKKLLGNENGNKFEDDIQNTISGYFPDETDKKENNSSNSFISADFADIKSKKLVGEELKNPMFAQYVAGMAVMFLLFSLSRAGSSILEEKQEGTLDRLLIAPIKPYTIILSKLFYASFLGIFQLMIMFVFGWLVFGLDIFSHIITLTIMIVVTAFAASALGMFIAAISKNQSQIGGLTTLIALGMSALGGSMFPSFIMPKYLQTIGKFTLNHWAMEGMTGIFWRDMSLKDIYPDIAVLLAIFIVFASIAIIIFNKRFFKKI